MRTTFAAFALAFALAAPAHAAMVAKDLRYQVGGKEMQSVLVYDDAVKTPRPGLVMTPDWLGMNDDTSPGEKNRRQGLRDPRRRRLRRRRASENAGRSRRRDEEHV